MCVFALSMTPEDSDTMIAQSHHGASGAEPFTPTVLEHFMCPDPLPCVTVHHVPCDHFRPHVVTSISHSVLLWRAASRQKKTGRYLTAFCAPWLRSQLQSGLFVSCDPRRQVFGRKERCWYRLHNNQLYTLELDRAENGDVPVSVFNLRNGATVVCKPGEQDIPRGHLTPGQMTDVYGTP